MANSVQIFIFDEETDLDAIVAEVGPNWRAIFEELADELDLVYAVDDHLLTFRMTRFGEDVDLDGYAAVVGRDWRAVLEQLSPALDAAFTLSAPRS
jgi:hypothetical protein